MKFKLILSLILALAVMIFGRELSLRKRVFLVIQKEDIRIEHLTVTDKIGSGDVKIEAKITTPKAPQDYAKKLFYKIDDGAYNSVDFIPEDKSGSQFITFIPAQQKGKRGYYYLMVEDNEGNKVTLPDRIESIDPPFMLKFKGEVPAIIIIAHVLGMLAGLFFTFLALFFAIDTLLGKDVLSRLGFSISFTALSVFIGGILLGALVTNYTFGGYWEGIPIGWDITDNKTLIIFLYWLIMLILMKGTILKKDQKLNLLRPISLSVFTLMGVLLTIFLYIVPHSIRL